MYGQSDLRNWRYHFGNICEEDVEISGIPCELGEIIASRFRHEVLAESLRKGKSSLAFWGASWVTLAQILVKVSGLQVDLRRVSAFLKSFQCPEFSNDVVDSGVLASCREVINLSVTPDEIEFGLTQGAMTFSIRPWGRNSFGDNLLTLEICPEGVSEDFRAIVVKALLECPRNWGVISSDRKAYYHTRALLALLCA